MIVPCSCKYKQCVSVDVFTLSLGSLDVNPQLFQESMLSLPLLAVLTINGGEMLGGHFTDDFLEGCREHGINELLVWPDYFRDGSERFEVTDVGIIRFCDRESSPAGTNCRLCMRYANVSPKFTSKMIEVSCAMFV